jgi:hypothetical protein
VTAASSRFARPVEVKRTVSIFCRWRLPGAREGARSRRIPHRGDCASRADSPDGSLPACLSEEPRRWKSRPSSPAEPC